MRKFLICFVLVCSLFSQTVSFASKSNPNMIYDFENQSSGEITYSGKETQRFKTTFETGIGGRDDNGYSHKVYAGTHTANNGSSQYTLTIPTGQSDSSMVTTEFDLYCNITANPDAKDKVVPAFLVYLSNVNILWFNPTTLQSVQESWKRILDSSVYNGLWSKVAITTDRAQGTFTVFMNGEAVISNVALPASFSDSSCIKLEWTYWYNAPGEDCYFAIDNLISYDGILTPDDKITWQTQNGEISSVSEIASGDTVTVSYEKYNYGDQDVELTAVLLVRNGSKLVSARSQKVLVPVAEEPTVIEAAPVEITNTSELEIRYIFLNSWEERIPLCEAYTLN